MEGRIANQDRAIDRNVTEASSLGFKEHYEMNKWQLMGTGDILLLHTDGLSEHRRGDEDYAPTRLEAKVREVKDRDARGIYDAVMAVRPSPDGCHASPSRGAM